MQENIMNLSIKRILIYLIGMIVLAAGLTLNTKTTLGVSPILTVPFSVSEIYSLNFADLVFIWYFVFVILQLIIHFFVIHEKDKMIYLSDILQIVISVFFTRVMNFFSVILPVFETDCQGFLTTIWFRLIALCFGVVLIALGAAMSLSMKLVPNPGDGIVAALSSAIHKPIGTCKNIVDISCVIITVIFSFLHGGKFYGVGIGTLISMIGVGRAMNIINRKIDFTKYLN